MLKQFLDLHGDPLIYGGLAKNLVLHGSYALTGGGGELCPTLIRLPGYPLFLALCFRFFGWKTTYPPPGCRLRWSWPGACCWPILRGASRGGAGRASVAALHTPRCGWRRCARSRRFTQPSRLPSR